MKNSLYKLILFPTWSLIEIFILIIFRNSFVSHPKITTDLFVFGFFLGFYLLCLFVCGLRYPTGKKAVVTSQFLMKLSPLIQIISISIGLILLGCTLYFHVINQTAWACVSFCSAVNFFLLFIPF